MAPSALETITEVATWQVEQQVGYCDILLAELTVVNRDIWSNEGLTDAQRVDMLKWSNELAHRVWNLKWRLSHEGDDFATKLLGNIEHTIESQPMLSKLLPWALDSAKRRFERIASA